MAIRRIILVFVLLLLTVSAVAVVFASDADCVECCDTDNCATDDCDDCTDCPDCHCATTIYFVSPACTGSDLYAENCGSYHLPGLAFPERVWYSELDRPPRSLSC